MSDNDPGDVRAEVGRRIADASQNGVGNLTSNLPHLPSGQRPEADTRDGMYTTATDATPLLAPNVHPYSHGLNGATNRGHLGFAPVNPFTYPTPVGCWEVVKLVVCGLTLLPVRIILMLVFLLFMVFFSWLSVVGLSDEQRRRPLSSCRKVWQYPAMFCCRICLFIFGFYWIRVRGAPAAEARVLAIAPHSSFVDPVYFMWRHWPNGISAAENMRFPLISSILSSSQAILIDRNDPDSRRECMREMQRRAGEGAVWNKIMIFPEGLCTNRKALITFKKGAFVTAASAGCPIQPVMVDYPSWFFDPAWVPGVSPVWLLVRLGCQFVNFMTVDYLPPYLASEAEVGDAQLFANNVRRAMAEHANKPITHHGYEDCKLVHDAIRLRMPPEKAVVEYGRINELFDMDLPSMRAVLERFAATGGGRADGALSLEDFAEVLHLSPSAAPVRLVFESFDRSGRGEISFRDLLVGIATLNGRPEADEIIEIGFSLFDQEGDGSIPPDRFARLMRTVFPAVTQDEALRLFDKVDANDDHVITFDEFLAFGRAHPEYVEVFLHWRQTLADDPDVPRSPGAAAGSASFGVPPRRDGSGSTNTRPAGPYGAMA